MGICIGVIGTNSYIMISIIIELVYIFVLGTAETCLWLQEILAAFRPIGGLRLLSALWSGCESL